MRCFSELVLKCCLLPSISDQSQLSLSLNYLIVSMQLHSYCFFEQYGIMYRHFLLYKLNHLIVMVSSVSEQVLKCFLLPSISDQSQLSLSLNYLIVSMQLHSCCFFAQYEIKYPLFLPYKLNHLIVMVSSVSELVLKFCLLPSISDQSQLSLILNYLIVSMQLHSCCFFAQYEIKYPLFLPYKLNHLVVTESWALGLEQELVLTHSHLLSIFVQQRSSLILNYLIVLIVKRSFYVFEQFDIMYRRFLLHKFRNHYLYHRLKDLHLSHLQLEEQHLQQTLNQNELSYKLRLSYLIWLNNSGLLHIDLQAMLLQLDNF